MDPTIEPTDEPGLTLHDPIEGSHFGLLTDRPVSPSPADPGRVPFPVDAAVTVEAGELVVPTLVHLTVRRPDGDYLAEFRPDGSEVVEGGDRLLDISSAPMLLYIQAPGPMTFRSGTDAVRMSFEEPGEVVVGCRSFHERPAATVTVPPTPEAAMTAVSTFGSALKTTSCERSYPTLRGHPPRIEVGTELAIPDGIECPETGVRIEVPPELQYVLPVAPLAYYLGAAVQPGAEPVLRADGLAHPLDGPDGFEAAVHGTLQRVFFFDALVRTEGLYQVPLAERAALTGRLDDLPPLSELYDASLPERLGAYLSASADVRDLLPAWPLCVDVTPEPANLEALPYLVDDLALVRCVSPDRDGGLSTPEVEAETRAGFEAAVEQFVRSEGNGDAPAGGDDGASGGDSDTSVGDGSAPGDAAGAAPKPSAAVEDTFRLPTAPAMEHAYIGPGCPLGVNKCSASTLRRRLDRSPAENPGISVRIVCNDEAMADEDVVEEYYGLRELVQFDVTVDYGLSKQELREVLASDVDFLHYVGHIDEAGIACTDGTLDARTLDDVGVDTFLLNACTSYEQGQALVEAGALGGVVTTAAVSNTVATAMGRTIARALNSGFTLRSALSIADEHHPTAYRYLVLGDGGLQLVQGKSGMPYSLSIEPFPDGGAEEYRVELHAYPAADYSVGSLFTLHIAAADNYLAFGHLDTFRLAAEDLTELLDLEVVPVAIDGHLYWSDEISRADLR